MQMPAQTGIYSYHMTNHMCRCAFLHFCVVKRPKLKQENPSLSVGAMAKQLSSAWKLMTSDQKKPYDDMADRDKQRSVILLLICYSGNCGVRLSQQVYTFYTNVFVNTKSVIYKGW